MQLLEQRPDADDDKAFLSRLQNIFAGAIRQQRPEHAQLVKIDNWFGPRWRGFVGKRSSKDVHTEGRLTIPPFAPKRVRRQAGYIRRGDRLEHDGTYALHGEPLPNAGPLRYIDEFEPSGLFAWYSGNTASQDRGALMIYEVERGQRQRAWYADFQRRDGAWSIPRAQGISLRELKLLETSYDDKLAPLEGEMSSWKLWDAALEASFDGRLAQASVLIERYRRRFPEESPIHLLRARNLAERRDFARALPAFQSIRPPVNDRHHKLWLSLWIDHCELWRHDVAAQKACRRLTQLEPGDPYAWLSLGGAYERAGRHGDAEIAYRHAATLEGDADDRASVYANLGLALRDQLRFEEAKEALERALELSPPYSLVKEALDDLQAAALVESSSEERETELWDRLSDAVHDEEIARAAALLNVFATRYGESPALALLRARHLSHRRAFAEAEAAFSACEPHPEQPLRVLWLYHLGRSRQRMGRSDTAEQLFREAVDLRPDHTLAWVELGACLAQQGKQDEAVQILLHATTLEGDVDEAYLELGLALRAMLRFEEAAVALDKAVELDSDDSGEAAQVLEDVCGALALLEQGH